MTIARQYVTVNGDVRNYGYAKFHTPAVSVARSALRIGPMVDCGTHWLFGRRFFNKATLAVLIATGEAVRRGNKVYAAVGQI